jgi:dihydroorotate dehydrogenase
MWFLQHFRNAVLNDEDLNERRWIMLPHHEQKIDCRVQLLPRLEVEECIGIPSCHFTGSIKNIDALAPLGVAFFTLKSTSIENGSTGKGKRLYRTLDEYGMPASYFANGDKSLELLDLATTTELLVYAKKTCPTSKIGVSLTAGEDYSLIIPQVEACGVDFIELCYKYTPRSFRKVLDFDPSTFMPQTYAFVKADVERAVSLSRLPILIKLPRDLPWISSACYMSELQQLAPEQLGFVLIDTQKYHFYLDQKSQGRTLSKVAHEEGVLCGSSLFPETLSVIHRNYEHGLRSIWATGGISDANDAVHVMEHGASTVLLCSVLQMKGLKFLHEFRTSFKQAMAIRGYTRADQMIGAYWTQPDENEQLAA